MAKRVGSQSDQLFIKLYRELTYRWTPWEVWQDFVTMFACSISNAVEKLHFDAREAMYLKRIQKYNAKEQEIFPQLAAEVVFVVMDYGVIGLKSLLGWHQMNKTWTNKGGWLASDMRRYLNEEVIELLPDDLLAAIKPRKFGAEEDRLWLFSEVEIFGEHIWGAGDEGDKQLEYFKNPINRVKFDEDGDADWWWERSPSASDSLSFCGVNSDGNAGYHGANDSWGVCFGFYI